MGSGWRWIDSFAFLFGVLVTSYEGQALKRRSILFFLVFIPITHLALIATAEDNLPALIKKIQPAVITVIAYDEKGQPLSQGSGFIISNKGDLITNRHVIEGAYSAEIKIRDGKTDAAKEGRIRALDEILKDKAGDDKTYVVKGLVAEDREGDIVQLVADIPEKAVQELKVTSAVPEAGERIAVIGSPLGLEQSVSDGIVSAVRDIPGFGRIFQITAPISPGSSGSPVVNMKGEVIGVAWRARISTLPSRVHACWLLSRKRFGHSPSGPLR